LQQSRQRGIGTAGELLQLVPANAIDEKTENREIFPGGDETAERLQVALLVWTTQDVCSVDADVAGEARELAKVVDLFGGGARHDQLIDLTGRRRQHRVDIQVRSADLA